MHRSGLVLACLFAAAGWSAAASPDPDDLAVPPEVQVKSRALVRQLGSEEYAEREEAQRQLADLGRLARPALLAGVNTSPDPEVRLRCAELLPAASALDLRARIDTFLADAAGEYEHDLPPWKTFRAAACREWPFFGRTVWSDRSAEKAARRVFAELLLSSPDNRRLLAATGGSRVELADLVVARRQELYNRRYPRGTGATPRDPTLEEMTVLLFAESRVGSQYMPRRSSITSLLSESGFTSAARAADEKARVYRAVAAAWLDSRDEPREMYQAMSIAANLGLNDEACGLAVRLLVMPGVTASYRGRAASNLLSYGGKQHVPLLEKALGEALAVYTVRIPAAADGDPDAATYEVRLGDLALAVSVLLSEQKLADYGFADRYAGNAAYDDRSFSYTRYYFPNDAARTRALAKWAAWRKADPDG
jgi:hypothetical protein